LADNDRESPVQVYYDAGRTYPTIRLHPYTATGVEQAGYVDFKTQPERIPEVLEDFRPYADREGIQAFYELLGRINGADSQLESCDSAFRPPAPQKDANSHRALSAYGRLYILFRNLTFNCSANHVKWLTQELMRELTNTDPDWPPSEGVVGFTLIKILQLALSAGEWLSESEFSAADDDPGYGQHLMLSFWAYGETEYEVYVNLGRLFRNIGVACEAVSKEITKSLKAHGQTAAPQQGQGPS
jgi:hypothetical protein